MQNDDKTRNSKGGKQFTSEYQPQSNGRPKGSISLETRIRNLLEDTESLPAPIREAIKIQCGGNVKAMDAMIVVGLLQALQGDKAWAQLIWEQGWGKAAQKVDMTTNGKDVQGVTIVVGSQADKDILDKI